MDNQSSFELGAGKALMVVTRSQALRLPPAAHLEQGESSDFSSRIRPTQEPGVAIAHKKHVIIKIKPI